MPKGPTRSEALEATWRARIARHAASGRTARDFCRQEKLQESSFYYWRRELARRHGQSAARPPQGAGRKPARRSRSPFLPIAVACTTAAPLEIALPDQVSIRVWPGCDASLLTMVVAALREP
jgi:transposase-like protein